MIGLGSDNNRITNFQKGGVQAQTQDSLHTLQARQTKTLPTLQQPFSQDKANDGQTILCQRIFLYSLFSDFCAWSRRQPKHYIYEKWPNKWSDKSELGSLNWWPSGRKRIFAFRLQIHPFGLKYACNITSHSQNQNLNESLAVSFYFIIIISLTGHALFLGGVGDGALSYRPLCKDDKAGIDWGV